MTIAPLADRAREQASILREGRLYREEVGMRKGDKGKKGKDKDGKGGAQTGASE